MPRGLDVSSNAKAYAKIIERIFRQHYKRGLREFDFVRDEIRDAAKKSNVDVPSNLGDVIYTFRYRRQLPEAIRETCKEGEEWIIKGIGSGQYQFRKVPITEIVPQQGRYQIKVPDATPEIVAQHALTDEQALLAKLRYNRLIDLFTRLVTYSLQNHLRTNIGGVQIEIDELYVGVSRSGAHHVLPVQAKGGRDKLGRVQLEQDMECCAERFPDLICRPIAAQFMSADLIAIFELTIVEDAVKILDERHYLLVPASEIGPEDLKVMRREWEKEDPTR